MCFIPCPSHPSLFHHPNNMRWRYRLTASVV
jgi:hypothetical protein